MFEKMKWWKFSAEEIIKKFQTNLTQGLTNEEVARRLHARGLNILSEKTRISPVIIFVNQFLNVIVLTLLGALVILIFLGEWIEAVAIATIVVFNAIVGFIQEYSADRSLAALKKLSKPFSLVMRDGIVQKIPSSHIVLGDIVKLEAGDIVPADGRIITADYFIGQEAALTGESMPVHKTINSIIHDDLPIGDRTNMVFMGTNIVNGVGMFVVTATGIETELGAIARMLQVGVEEKTPLERQLQQLGHALLVICLIIVILVFLLGLLRNENFIKVVLTSLGLAVAAIPEGLPAIVTLTLAIGVQKMARRKALIRRLPSIETLGCVSVICTDKTGTLTQNEMTVRNIWVGNELFSVTGVGYAPQGQFMHNQKIIEPQTNTDLILALKIGTLCNNADIQNINSKWQVLGDPTEAALLTASAKAGLTKSNLFSESPRLSEIPFDSERKRMSTLYADEKENILFLKGAPDVITKLSTFILINGQIIPMTDHWKALLNKANNDFASQALRVLSVAYRKVDKNSVLNLALENELVFVGLIAMIDPPRPEVKSAIEKCKMAGIRTVMITGDYKETGVAIAKELGIFGVNDIAISGDELDLMTDEELKAKIRNITVYARTSASHKNKIVQVWKSLDEIVAVTGDGVNDAPAIKAADIGIAMGITGTEVTKEASDMVLTDDNFASIVSAVEEGRGIYQNIIKFVTYLVSTNIAELIVIFMAMALNFTDPSGAFFIALTPLQLLWLNLVTDGFPAMALGVDPLDPKVMEQPPRKLKARIVSFKLAIELIVIGALLASGALVACYYGLRQSASLAQTMVLAIFVFLEFSRIQAIRSRYNLSFFSNKWLLLALGTSLMLQGCIIYIPALQNIFKTTALGLFELFIISIITAIVWLLIHLASKAFKD